MESTQAMMLLESRGMQVRASRTTQGWHYCVQAGEKSTQISHWELVELYRSDPLTWHSTDEA